jgi:trehalose 6-phosphate synthase/phosphatase
MSKIILVSNRLPVTISKDKGQINIVESSGGLATGLKSLLEKQNCLWIGYPGIPSNKITKKEKSQITETLLQKFKCIPVYLSKLDIKQYYEGFSNKTIWPLFHYFQSITHYDNDMWDSYKRVNKLFLDTLTEIVEPDDVIWINDYHLMLLPKLIREQMPSVKIGFFLHIPFPSYEIFRLLPWKEEILEGLLGSDLIGFHTISYVRHFLNSTQYLLGVENAFGNINIDGRWIKIEPFPMGIDYERYSDASQSAEVKKEIMELKPNFENMKIILSMDRLDYTKGLLQRLESFQYFLEKYPEYHKKVILIVVAVPSRVEVDEYGSLTNKLEMIVSRINGKFSTIDWTPIRYLYQGFAFEKIIALYSIADVALITPLRDGMNLVAKEYLAVKTHSKKGVLIISEMAGVAEELSEALVINPNHKSEIAKTIHEALSMPLDKQGKKLEVMQKSLMRNNIFKWANDFIDKLQGMKGLENKPSLNILAKKNKEDLITHYKQSQKRLLLFDYDGTLVPFQNKPENSSPDEELLMILQEFVKNANNKVVVISGREKNSLNEWLGHLNINLVAEHGAWLKEPGKSWKEVVGSQGDSWKEELRPTLEAFVDKTPKSYIEEKTHTLVFHYRRVDPSLASMRIRELKATLLSQISNRNLTLMEGHKILEIKRNDFDKGMMSYSLIQKLHPDFVLGFGDDTTDEDIFKVLSDKSYAYSIKVGIGDTHAKFYIESQIKTRKLLQELSKMP